MKTSRLFLILAALAVVVLAGCGGGSNTAELSTEDVAGGGGQQHTKGQVPELLEAVDRGRRGRRRPADHEGAVPESPLDRRGELQAAGPDLPEAGHVRV